MERTITMSENCNGNCSACGETCDSRQAESLLAQANPLSSVKKVIGIVSGKGGVGKSTVTSMLAVELNRRGMHTAVLDADITGPSIPKALNIKGRPEACEEGMLPIRSATGIDVMSVNLLLENETDPVIWRGPILGGVIKQFWSDVVWKDVDFLFVDMPPGTGDVPLTVFQSLPLDGIIVVTSPQDLVSMIVTKAVKMAEMMNVPVLGLVENYSYLSCPDCGKKIAVFGKSRIEEVAAELKLPVLGKLPIDPLLAQAMDEGLLEHAKVDAIGPVADALQKL